MLHALCLYHLQCACKAARTDATVSGPRDGALLMPLLTSAAPSKDGLGGSSGCALASAVPVLLACSAPLPKPQPLPISSRSWPHRRLSMATTKVGTLASGATVGRPCAQLCHSWHCSSSLQAHLSAVGVLDLSKCQAWRPCASEGCKQRQIVHVSMHMHPSSHLYTRIAPALGHARLLTADC